MPTRTAVVSPREIAARLTELWSPRVVAELDDSYIKVARVQGEFTWHDHAGEDELFFVLAGQLSIHMQDRTVELSEGQLFVVPKGVRHKPVASAECLLLLVERKTTLHTGTTESALTRSADAQLRPVEE